MSLDTNDFANYGYGGPGNDSLYGTASGDVMWGDEKDGTDPIYGNPYVIDPEDTRAGDDFMKGH